MTEVQSTVSFNLADIQTEQFAIIETAYSESEVENIHLHSSFRFGFNETDHTILASPRFSFDQKDNSFLILEVACVYGIQEESWETIYNMQERTVTLPKGFAAHLAALSVGVARGVLHAKTEQTSFNKFMIPLINVAENIKDDVVLR